MVTRKKTMEEEETVEQEAVECWQKTNPSTVAVGLMASPGGSPVGVYVHACGSRPSSVFLQDSIVSTGTAASP